MKMIIKGHSDKAVDAVLSIISETLDKITKLREQDHKRVLAKKQSKEQFQYRRYNYGTNWYVNVPGGRKRYRKDLEVK